MRFVAAAWSSVVFSLVAVAFAAPAVAEEIDYYSVPVGDLELTEGKWDLETDTTNTAWGRADFARPYIVLDGAGEVYWSHPNDSWGLVDDRTTWGRVNIRRPHADAAIAGTFFYPKRDYRSFGFVKFKIAADKASGDHRKEFLDAKIRHYGRLQSQGFAGGAWFRHQVRSAQRELTGNATTGAVEPPRSFDSFRPWSEFDDTFSLFSGNRAVSENLQLDRVLPAARADESPVKLDTVQGITIDEIDWSKYLAGKNPKLDALAKYIPADQHVLFFPNFAAAMRLADEAEAQGTPLLEMAEPQSQDADVVGRYQRQLGLKTTALGRMLGPSIIKSMALTGGDPYFRIGTDLALVFEAYDLTTLKTALAGQVTLNTTGEAGLTLTSGKIVDGARTVAYDYWSTPDRRVSSYVAGYENVVIVTNSLEQLKGLVAVYAGGRGATVELKEFQFFRDRYPRGDERETAFLFISDPTIRRWCGPRWRIADSRRTRDLAVLAELQAAQVDKLARNQAEPGTIYSDWALSAAGEIKLSSHGVRSETVGSLGFMTPIAELPLDTVAKSEAEAYGRWRDGYQNNFSWAFDPIGLRFTVADDRLAGDLTVMPLIDNSDYRDFIAISRGVSLKPTSGDPHDAAFHAVLAINKDSARLKELGGMAGFFFPQLKVDPLSWIGESAALYVDDSPLWNELDKLKDDADREKFFREHAWELPIAVHAEVSSAFKATAFLAAIRAFIEQTGPGMTLWEVRQLGDDSYVKVSPTEKAVPRGTPEEKIAIYYALTSDSLTISLSEDVIKRSLARRAERGKAEKPSAEKSAKPSEATTTWLGEQLCLEAGRRALHGFAALSYDSYQNQLQRLAWSNLPVLNEWRRRYPDQDSVELHERLWDVKLVCPGGGKYVWNEKFQTYESTVFGHPGEPKLGAALPAALNDVSRARFGVTFEEQGLRTGGDSPR
ncbi:MAG: hypothetical protein QM775_27265 [Pirellulales bacterium]